MNHEPWSRDQGKGIEEDREQRTEDRGQRTENREQRTEIVEGSALKTKNCERRTEN
jgi:hypothetical protein